MGLNLSVPLPGPLSYSRRIGGRSTGPGATYWALIGWWLVPTMWLLVVTVSLLATTARLTVLSTIALYRYTRRITSRP